MRRLIVLLLLLMPRLAMAQYPSPIFNTATVNGALTATGGGTLGGTFAGTPTMSALWRFNGGLTTNLATITGGSINGTAIGATTPSTGAFTTASTTGNLTVGGSFSALSMVLNGPSTALTVTNNATIGGSLALAGTGTALTVTNSATIGGTLTINPLAANPLSINSNTIQATGTGNGPLNFRTLGGGNFNFFTEGGATEVFQINDTANAISWLRVASGILGNGPTIQAVGDTAANLNLFPGTTGTFNVGGARTVLSGMLQINGNRTYVGTNAINNTGPNYAAIWQDTQVTGTTGAGASTYNFIRVTDTLNANASGFYPLNIGHTINAGWDGFRQALAVNQQVLAASGGHGNLNTIGFFAKFGGPGNQINEGGTGNPNDSSSWHAATVNVNIDTTCNVLYSQGCENEESDMRNMAPTFSKKILILSYSINDSAHGLDDCAICIVGNTSIAPGTGRGLYIVELGGETSGWPLDESNPNTVIMGEFKQNVGNQGSGYPFQSNAGHGWYFPGANFVNDAWLTTGHKIDGAGQLFVGPGSITYDQTGLYMTASNVTTLTATVVAGGVGYIVNDHVLEPVSGGQFLVTSVTTIGASTGIITGLAPLSPVRPGFPTTCPSGAMPLVGGGGHVATATITCSSPANQITIGGAGQTVNLLGTVNLPGALSLTSPTIAGGTITGLTSLSSTAGPPGTWLPVHPVGNAGDGWTFSTTSIMGNSQSGGNLAHREFMVNIGFTVNTANGSGPNEGNVAIYEAIDCLNGAGNCWARNTLATLEAGNVTSQLRGDEVDINNLAANHGETPGPAGIVGQVNSWGITVATGGLYRNTGGIGLVCLQNGSQNACNRGFVAVNGIQQASFEDDSQSIGSFVSYGTHTYGLDTSGAVLPSGAAVHMANNQRISAVNAAGSADLQMAALDASNILQLGTNLSEIQMFQSSGGAASLVVVGNIIAQGSTANITLDTQGTGIHFSRAGPSRMDTTSPSGTFQFIRQNNSSLISMTIDQFGNVIIGPGSVLATNATNGFLGIPTIAAAPTGTPATTGGASVVYNTASHNLNIYDPVAAGWYHVAMTAGAN